VALHYAVPPGTVLRCDYSRGGFQPPEMVKARPVVVISPRLPHRDWLCTVVPISTTYSGRDLAYEVRLEFNPPLPEPFSSEVAWAKCDMLATVGFARLDMFRTARDQTGKRKYIKPKLGPADLARVQQGVLFALGLHDR
jgi:mRNA interferase MazF